MKFNLPTLAKTTIAGVAITATLGCLASSADALTLASSSGSWSNVLLDNGITVNPPGGNTVEFFNVGNESQVRWGVPFSSSDAKSGLGFTGVTTKTFDVGDMFELGTLRHFNNVTSTFSPVADAANLGITLDFSSPDVEQTFTFNFAIDNTPNAGPCQVGSPPCADIVTFPSAFPTETFNIGGVDYTLELLGFRDSVTGDPVGEFVSAENGTNSATLFAKITTPPSEKVPEPTAMVGLGLLGLYIMGRRNQKQKLH
ncbi:MAG: THxN family PEP-CTERM protein [Coleofasciculus sp. G1-WW12-02]|uniref:THxN family PEP-CTERM protein n=1 Tax=Coleofasciculus sp. G1-WW12-02 TaxID=3068483 RepID=UPI0032F59453